MWAEEKQHHYMTPDETAVIELKAAALGHSNRWHCEVAKVTHQDTAPASLGLMLGGWGQLEVRPSCPGYIPWVASPWQSRGKSRLTSTQYKRTQPRPLTDYSRLKRSIILQVTLSANVTQGWKRSGYEWLTHSLHECGLNTCCVPKRKRQNI